MQRSLTTRLAVAILLAAAPLFAAAQSSKPAAKSKTSAAKTQPVPKERTVVTHATATIDGRALVTACLQAGVLEPRHEKGLAEVRRLSDAELATLEDRIEARRQLASRQTKVEVVDEFGGTRWMTRGAPETEKELRRIRLVKLRAGLAQQQAMAAEIARLLPVFKLLPDDPKLFDEWYRLVTQYGVQGKPAHDARIVAAMLVHGVTHLLTFNVSDFSRYKSEITILDPATV